jgi:hypothetical protein
VPTPEFAKLTNNRPLGRRLHLKYDNLSREKIFAALKLGHIAAF